MYLKYNETTYYNCGLDMSADEKLKINYSDPNNSCEFLRY